jgi:hypothetical protein
MAVMPVVAMMAMMMRCDHHSGRRRIDGGNWLERSDHAAHEPEAAKKEKRERSHAVH